MSAISRASILAGLICCLVSFPAAAGEDDLFPVACPSLHYEDSPYTSAPIGGAYRTDLVVVGTGRKDDDGQYGIDVEEVLFGVASSPRIALSRGPEGRWIFTLEAGLQGGPEFRLLDSSCPSPLPATAANLAGARALACARFETIVLSAEAVVVGRETAFGATRDLKGWHDSDFVRMVQVNEVLAGPAALKGRTVRVKLPGIAVHGRKARLAEEERVYFIGGHSGYRWPSGRQKHQEPVVDRPLLRVNRVMPREIAGEVPAVLAVRGDLPIIETGQKDERRRCREVVFHGSVSEALEILHSDCYGAAALASRSLVLRPGESRAPVLAAIREQLFDLEVGEPDRYRTLNRLIGTLGSIERKQPQGDLAKLIEAWFELLESGRPPAPGTPPAPPRSFRGRIWYSANRSLLWLLKQLPPERARGSYGDRLLELRESVGPEWKPVIEQFLDELRVEEARETPRAIAAAAGLDRAVSPAGPVPTLAHTNDQVTYSGKGHWLAFDTGKWIQIRRTEDRKPVARLRYEPSVCRLRFSPDDRFLYVAGGGGLARYLVLSGELDRRYEALRGWVTDLVVSRDGRTLAALNNREDRLLFLDAESGTVLREEETGRIRIHLAPGNDGVLRRSGRTGWLLLPLRGEGSRTYPMDGTEARSSLASGVASADGRTFAVLNTKVVPPFATKPGSVRVYRWDGEKAACVGHRALASATMAQYGALSPDGGMLALAGDGNVVRVFSVPELNLLGEVRFPLPRASKLSIESLAFRPDGQVLAVAIEEAIPALVDLRTFTRMRTHDGHSDEVAEVVFAEDGEVILTRGRDRVVCSWDAATLDTLGRVELPPGFEFVGADWLARGRILCHEMGCAFRVLDARTGKILHEARLPRWTSTRGIRLISDHRLLIFSDRGDRARFFDLRSGEASGGFDRPEERFYQPRLAEDGRTLFAPGTYGKGGREARVRRIDLSTGEAVSLPIPGVTRLRYRSFGLVPDGHSLCYSDPGVLVLDRGTLQTISRSPLRHISLGDLAFSGDGKRYVGAAKLKNHPEEVRKVCPAEARTLIRVHDTKTGRTLYAFPTPSYRPKVALDADGRRLVIVEDDGKLVVVTLPL